MLKPKIEMEKTDFLNHVAPYFNGNVAIEHFINENENYLKSIKTVDSIDDFFAFTRIYYDYSLHLINEGKIAKALIYLDSILTVINKHEKVFQVSFKKEKVYEYTLLHKGKSLMRLKKHNDAKKCFQELEILQPENDEYKEYKQVCNMHYYTKIAWPLYIVAILIWTIRMIENWIDKDFMPKWALDFAWIVWIIGLILQFAIPYFANKSLRKIQ